MRAFPFYWAPPLHGAITAYNEVITYTGPALGTVPAINFGDTDISRRSSCCAMHDDVRYAPHLSVPPKQQSNRD